VSLTRSLSPRLVALVPLLAALLAPAAGSAQTISSPYRFLDHRHEAELFVGQMVETRGRLGLGPGGGTLVGGRYSLQVVGPAALEGGLTLLQTDREVWDPRPAAGREFLGMTDVTLLSAEVRLRFTLTGQRTWNHLAPYLHLGLGIVQDFAKVPESEELIPGTDRFSFGPSAILSFGGGTRWFPGNRWILRAEGGWTTWKVGTPPGFSLLPTTPSSVSDQEWVRVPTLVFGAAYRP
jgi:hypothetical protein